MSDPLWLARLRERLTDRLLVLLMLIGLSFFTALAFAVSLHAIRRAAHVGALAEENARNALEVVGRLEQLESWTRVRGDVAPADVLAYLQAHAVPCFCSEMVSPTPMPSPAVSP